MISKSRLDNLQIKVNEMRVTIWLAVCVLVNSVVFSVAGAEKPNVLFIVSDDQGFAGLR